MGAGGRPVLEQQRGKRRKQIESPPNPRTAEETQEKAPGVGEMWGATEEDGGTRAAEALGRLREKEKP